MSEVPNLPSVPGIPAGIRPGNWSYDESTEVDKGCSWTKKKNSPCIPWFAIICDVRARAGAESERYHRLYMYILYMHAASSVNKN
eukprot:5799539-Pyramimonas_sp.AAC.2